MDSYDQAGMMSGEIIVEGERRELCLWGFKIKNQEYQPRRNSPLVSDIRSQCSKVPDLTGGKGSSLAVLDSIAREVKTVLSAVVKCWASQFNFTTVNYKRQYGQPLDVPMAVVVQELVNADTAGVMFTCCPLTGNPGLITLTANYGIGEVSCGVY
ncbi:hypothetical protein MTO96_051619 [Rhipicephalus appendiculatus]